MAWEHLEEDLKNLFTDLADQQKIEEILPPPSAEKPNLDWQETNLAKINFAKKFPAKRTGKKTTQYF